MKISRFIGLSCLSLVLAGFSYQTSIHAEKSSQTSVISQSAEADNSAEIQASAEKVIDAFFAKDFETVINSLHPNLKSELSVESLRQIWITTNGENGAFQGRKQSRVINTPVSDLVIVTLEFAQVTEDWILIFNKEGQIIGTDFPSSKNIETIAKEFIYSLASGNVAEARRYLHPFLKEDIFPQQLQDKWQALVAEKGNFEQITATNIRRGSTFDNTDVLEMDLEFGKSDAQILVIFDSSKSIIGVDLVQ